MQTSTHIMDQEVHLTYCPVCGYDAEEIAIGEVMKYYTVDSGELLGYGHPGGILALALIECEVEYKTVSIEVTDRAPAGDPCTDCAADIAHQHAEFKVEVEKGGVHWHCDECGLYGVVAHDDSRGFSARVRQRSGIQPPTHIGVTFKDCKQHESEEDPAGTIH